MLTFKENPTPLKEGFSFEAFDVGSTSPKIHFGPMSAVNCKWAIRVNQRPVFWINEPEGVGGPFRLNAEMRNVTGKVIFSIIDNEWRIRTENWDAEVIGPRISIRNGPRQIALVLRTAPPTDLFIEHMDMSVEGHRLLCDGKNFTVTTASGYTVQAQNLKFDGCQVAVEIADEAIAFGSGGGSVSFSGTTGTRASPRIIDPKIQRNVRCPCGSGRRYKHCCGAF
ncbi:MAG: SEC-C domain-containing protein [Mesorhizobium sp.]|uniref:SEC-C metal-binding domain-containing protein n=1 Tax=Mesorhizobium sp. TaxID=1871066 RepID=UPI001ACBE961|nr:SEC-C metal-binding domain-containing protein [Mesorhizobium sp.]MBN9222449.1 SEC-C domain-containing protein [Mesorhizobium sp.]